MRNGKVVVGWCKVRDVEQVVRCVSWQRVGLMFPSKMAYTGEMWGGGRLVQNMREQILDSFRGCNAMYYMAIITSVTTSITSTTSSPSTSVAGITSITSSTSALNNKMIVYHSKMQGVVGKSR